MHCFSMKKDEFWQLGRDTWSELKYIEGWEIFGHVSAVNVFDSLKAMLKLDDGNNTTDFSRRNMFFAHMYNSDMNT